MGATCDDQRFDGELNCCPACGESALADLGLQFGDMNCTNCGRRLFFIKVGRMAKFFAYPQAKGLREGLIAAVARVLNINESKITPETSFVDDLGADSLDMVELIMELEEEGDDGD